ncbi:putative powdery mildew resistance protein, RPW8 [Rosa chinensis]|uniref:Putative powdery mildew resistance protein, RPW8 n=1 Tax=Rosa chinensis TaxID=74649 RepID=A0A2P6RN31_ROSCH|nr:uncharacterized protein LOC112188601 [Rosa chinensis]PRQ47843.1 putative powdery mildew resistance protein, RPW8 [Rosa chinensis]
MADLVAGAVLGAAFAELCDGVKNKVMPKSTTPQLLRDLVSKLESLGPLISEIKEYNSFLDHPIDEDLEEVEQLVVNGKLLISKCANFKGGPWNNRKKNKYKNKLEELDKSLAPLLERLRGQARDLRMELVRARNSADATEVAVETQSDIEIQPFSRRIQNWMVNRSYGSWGIMFMILFLVSMVMAATGSTGTKWFVFNFGINYLGINNY